MKADTSPNKGRKFWRCGQAENSCSFFEWDDEPPRGANSLVGSPATTGECYQVSAKLSEHPHSDVHAQCHQTGHWANGECKHLDHVLYLTLGCIYSACPNNTGGNSKRARTFGSAVNTSSAIGPCFTCHQEGHFSKGERRESLNFPRFNSSIDCPAVKNTYRSSSSGSTFLPTCYKCGMQGHLSNGTRCATDFLKIYRFFHPACGGDAKRSSSGARGARRGRGSTKSTGKRGRSSKPKITYADLYASD